MKAIAEREIDDAISSAEGHGRFGSLGSQWMQARTDSARQNDADRLFMHRVLSPADFGALEADLDTIDLLHARVNFAGLEINPFRDINPMDIDGGVIAAL